MTAPFSKYTVSKLAFDVAEPAAALGAGGSINLLIKCPAASASFFGCWLDVRGAAIGGTANVFLFESPVVNADGSARTPRNRNRLDTPPACPVLVFAAPTLGGDGTQLEVDSATSTATLSQPARMADWVMKPGTNYLVRLTNTTGAPINALLALSLRVAPNSDYLYGPKSRQR